MKHRMMKPCLGLLHWPESVNWNGRWVADKERAVNKLNEGQTVSANEGANQMAKQREENERLRHEETEQGRKELALTQTGNALRESSERAERRLKDKKTAYQMCQLAFELRYLRDELIRTGAYNTLPPCKTALGDAAQQLETLAEAYRNGGTDGTA